MSAKDVANSIYIMQNPRYQSCQEHKIIPVGILVTRQSDNVTVCSSIAYAIDGIGW